MESLANKHTIKTNRDYIHKSNKNTDILDRIAHRNKTNNTNNKIVGITKDGIQTNYTPYYTRVKDNVNKMIELEKLADKHAIKDTKINNTYKTPDEQLEELIKKGKVHQVGTYGNNPVNKTTNKQKHKINKTHVNKTPVVNNIQQESKAINNDDNKHVVKAVTNYPHTQQINSIKYRDNISSSKYDDEYLMGLYNLYEDYKKRTGKSYNKAITYKAIKLKPSRLSNDEYEDRMKFLEWKRKNNL